MNWIRINFHRIYRISFALSNQSNGKFSNKIERIANKLQSNSSLTPLITFTDSSIYFFTLQAGNQYLKIVNITLKSPKNTMITTMTFTILSTIIHHQNLINIKVLLLNPITNFMKNPTLQKQKLQHIIMKQISKTLMQ